MGNFFEDFSIGQKIVHPLPRTISDGDVSLYIAFTGSRFALHSSDTVAIEMGYDKKPIDDVLMFHLTFGKSVQDISLNAIANLGYAEMSFPNSVFAGSGKNPITSSAQHPLSSLKYTPRNVGVFHVKFNTYFPNSFGIQNEVSGYIDRRRVHLDR